MGSVASPGVWNWGWNRSAIFETQDDVGYVGFVGRVWADGGEDMTRIPFVADGMLQMAAAREAAGVVVGSPAWFAWLAEDSARSFSFRSPAGDYTHRTQGAPAARRRLLGGLSYGCGSPVQEVLGHGR
jgi:hypothetical protein